jgi:predicted DNA-binding protein
MVKHMTAAARTVTQVAFQLPNDLLARVDELASRHSRSRAAELRSAVEAYLENLREQAIDEQLAAGYGAVPPDDDLGAAMAAEGAASLKLADLDW